MTLNALEFDLPANEPPRVRLPGTDAFVQVGRPIPRAIAKAGPRLELLLGGGSTSGPRKQLSSTLFSLLGVLALARHEGREQVTVEEVASRALLASSQGEPWRSARSLGTELLRLIVPPLSGSPGHAWSSDSTALVQVRQGRTGSARVSSGPFRLNPRYPIEGDGLRLRALFATQGPVDQDKSEDEQPPSYRTARARARLLTAAGCEADAVEVMVVALEHAGPLPDRERTDALRILAGLEMQLGWSQHARRHARAVVALSERLGEKALLADALHIQALIARQVDAFGDAILLGQRALDVLDASPLRRSADPQVVELQRSLGVSYSQAVRREERYGHFVARGACEDRRWGHATRLLRLAIEGAMERGNPADVAHSLMRLANHRLAQHHHFPDDDREIRDAAESTTTLTIPARAIWERELASEKLLRLGADKASEALVLLTECRENNNVRGYTHQIRLIDDTLRRAKIPLSSLPLRSR